MSRSYKKYPCWSAPCSRNGIHSGVHDSKRLANRKARRAKYWDTPSGNAYRRITNPWDIVDYKSVYYTHTRVMDAIEHSRREMEGREYPHENPFQYPRSSRYAYLYRKTGLEYYYYAK